MDTHENEVVIKVDDVSKIFKLPHEKTNSIKSVLLNFRKRRTFEKQRALKNVSFEVKKGEFFGIVGRNGSGKSTLLKLLAGIYTPTKGEISVSGSLTPFIELGVGFNPELTGRDNIFLNGALLGFNRQEVANMYDDIVGFAELERFMDQKLKNYSSGMQVRLAFSIAIRARGDILLLDEVLAVGDAAFQQKCFDYFETLKKNKKTVVFVSHDMSAVSRFCTSAIYIKGGEIIRRGDPEEIGEVYKLENIESVEDRQKNSTIHGPQLSSSHSLNAKIIDQTADQLKAQFSYKSNDKDPMYAAFSVLRDGISVAEMTTSPDKPLIGTGSVTYTLDISLFNPGVYQLTYALCRTAGRKPLAFGRSALKFAISGKDITRGAAMKLADTWDYSAKK